MNEHNDTHITVSLTGEDGRKRAVTFQREHDTTMTIGEALDQVPGYRRIIRPGEEEAFASVTGQQLPDAVPDLTHVLPPTGDSHAACPWCGNPITISKR